MKIPWQLSYLLLFWGSLWCSSLGCSLSESARSTADSDDTAGSEAALVSEATLVSPGTPDADTTVPDTIVGGAVDPGPLEGPLFNQEMIIRPDTTADLEILKVPTPDSIDPEMFVPPRQPPGQRGGPTQPFQETPPEADTLGSVKSTGKGPRR